MKLVRKIEFKFIKINLTTKTMNVLNTFTAIDIKGYKKHNLYL